MVNYFYICALRSIVIILYVVCFGCYILFTRQPDYFDSQHTSGTIIKQHDTLIVQFVYGGQVHHASVEYPFLHTAGEQAAVIFEAAEPGNAKLYAVLGYWITFGEVGASLFIIIALYWVAVSVTNNPTPEALIEELEMRKQKPRKPKYDS